MYQRPRLRSGASFVTGSNIPTAEETGPNPVDTYRPQDIEKLGIRNATDLQEFIPQENGRRDEPACERVQNERFVGLSPPRFAVPLSGWLRPPEI